MKILLTILLGLWSLSISAASAEQIDSIKGLLSTQIHDTTRADILNRLVMYYEFRDRQQAIAYVDAAIQVSNKNTGGDLGDQFRSYLGSSYVALGFLDDDVGELVSAMKNFRKALNLFEQVGNQKGMAKSLNNIGIIYRKQGLYPQSLEAYRKSLALKKEIDDQRGAASTNTNIGNIYNAQGDYTQALEHFIQANLLHEKAGNQRGVGISLSSIGTVYNKREEFNEARKYFVKALAIQEKINFKRGIAQNLNSIGNTYQAQSEHHKAIDYYIRAIEIAEAEGHQRGVALYQGNVGNFYMTIGNFDQSLRYFSMALQSKEQLGEKASIAATLHNMSILFHKFEKYDKALHYCKKSMEIAVEVGSKYDQIQAADRFDKLYISLAEQSTNRDEREEYFNKALHYFKMHTIISDSVFNEQKSKDIGRLEARFEYESAEEESLRIQNEQYDLTQQEERRRNNLQYSSILIILVLMVAFIVTMGRFSIPIRLAEGLIFFTFLLFFEFTLVVLDPYIETYSSGAPALKLMFNAVLAGLIFPLHSFFETKLKRRISS